MEITTQISVADLVTLFIAALGLGLGVANFVTELVRRKPHATVAFANYYDTSGRVGLAVTVANQGEAPFTVASVGFVAGRKKRVYPFATWGDVLPKVLHAGETCQVVIDRRCYADGSVRKVKCVFARTPVGHEFHSKRITKKFLGIE